MRGKLGLAPLSTITREVTRNGEAGGYQAAWVLTCLYPTDSGSLTAAELAWRLQVGQASISKAIGELEQRWRQDFMSRRTTDRHAGG